MLLLSDSHRSFTSAWPASGKDVRLLFGKANVNFVLFTKNVKKNQFLREIFHSSYRYCKKKSHFAWIYFLLCHLRFFEKCIQEEIYPNNLELTDHFQVAFTDTQLLKVFQVIDNCHILEKMHACINYYRLVKLNLTEKINEERNRLKSTCSPQRCNYLIIKSEQLLKKLVHKLDCTKKKKISNLLEIYHHLQITLLILG